MELATRPMSKKFVNGLSRCIERGARLSPAEKDEWVSVEEKGKKLFAPELGGSYEVFNARPLADDMRMYCEQDVKFMPRLWDNYLPKLTPTWARKVEQATEERVILSQSSMYIPHGRHKALGPWAMEDPADRRRNRRSFF